MLRSPQYKGVNVVDEDGTKVLRLVSGDPNVYEGGWDTPRYMKDAVIKAINDGYNMYQQYVQDLRGNFINAIITWEKKMNSVIYDNEHIIPTQGIAGGIRLLYSCILKQGDEIILTDPSYPTYINAVNERNGKAVFFNKIEENDWTPDLDDLRKKITKRTKGLVLIHPNNPTGALYDERTLKRIVDIVGEYNFPIISDELYRSFNYEEVKFHSLAAVAGDVPCIVMYSLSKAYVATGWRIGHIAIRDPRGVIDSIRKTMMAKKDISGTIPTPLIYGGIAAYEGPTKHIDQMVEELSKRRTQAHRRLNEIEGISCVRPKAAFFTFPKVEGVGKVWKDDREFVLDFKKSRHIEVGPGLNYGDVCSFGHIRIPFLPSVKVMGDVFDRLESFMKERLR